MKERFLNRYSGLEEPVHGGTPAPPGMLDFSISVNPFPLPESVSAAYARAWEGISRYPDTGCSELKTLISARYGTAPERLLLTNGSAEAFNLIAASFLDGEALSAVVSPCYSDYEKVSLAAGAKLLEYRLKPVNGFAAEGSRLLDFARKNKPDVTWLCSPNNPTGVVIEPAAVAELAGEADGRDGFVVIDEAYASFAPVGSELPRNNYPGLIRVRSMTKDFGIPGIRLGWVDAPPEIIRILNLNRPCWSVGFPAQQVGAALMGEFDYFRDSWARVKVLKEELVGGLKDAGINADGASVNECGVFVFFRLPEAVEKTEFIAGLGAKGIRLRDCSSMGAPGYFRAGVRLRNDNLRLVQAVKEILYKGAGQ